MIQANEQCGCDNPDPRPEGTQVHTAGNPAPEIKDGIADTSSKLKGVSKIPPPIELPPSIAALANLPFLSKATEAAANSEFKNLGTEKMPLRDLGNLFAAVYSACDRLQVFGYILGGFYELAKGNAGELRPELGKFESHSFTPSFFAEKVPALAALSTLPDAITGEELTGYIEKLGEKMNERLVRERLFYDLKRIMSNMERYFRLMNEFKLALSERIDEMKRREKPVVARQARDCGNGVIEVTGASLKFVYRSAPSAQKPRQPVPPALPAFAPATTLTVTGRDSMASRPSAGSLPVPRGARAEIIQRGTGTLLTQRGSFPSVSAEKKAANLSPRQVLAKRYSLDDNVLAFYIELFDAGENGITIDSSDQRRGRLMRDLLRKLPRNYFIMDPSKPNNYRLSPLGIKQITGASS